MRVGTWRQGIDGRDGLRHPQRVGEGDVFFLGCRCPPAHAVDGKAGHGDMDRGRVGKEHNDAEVADQQRGDHGAERGTGGKDEQQAAGRLDVVLRSHEVVGMRNAERVERKGEDAEEQSGKQDGLFPAMRQDDHADSGQCGAETGQNHDLTAVHAIRKAAQRPLADGAGDDDDAHKERDIGRGPAVALRKNRTERPERAIGQTDGEAADDADRRLPVKTA